MERPGVVPLGKFNDFGLGNKIGASLAAVADFKIFKISAGNRSILFARVERKGRHKMADFEPQ
jgi:hypothetical protein